MKTKALRLVVLSVVTQLTLSSMSFAAPWPALETDQERLAYGLALRSRMPRFFSDSFNYGIDWWSMTETQERLKRELTPLYPRSEDTRPLLKITLQESVQKSVPSAAEQSLWKSQLLAELAARGNPSEEALINELQTKVNDVLTMKPREILNALMKEATQKSRDFSIMKAPTSEKFAYLRANLPSDLTQTSFYKNSNKRYDTKNVRSLEHALSLVTELGAYEEAIPDLTALVVIGASGGNVHDALARLGDAEFAKLQDAKHVETTLRHAFGDTGAASQNENPLLQAALSSTAALSKRVQKLMADGSQVVQIKTPTMSLTEIPRDLAIMRSTVALDCTHTCSFATADDPTSRIYYARDLTNDKVLGYVQGQIKASPQGDVFYLTTINGPTITTDQAQSIIDMLHQNRAALGVKEIALTAKNYGFLMNYQAIVDYIEALAHGKPRIPIQPKNKKIAKIIDASIDADYMREHENNEAVIYHPASGVVAPSTAVEHLENNDVVQGKIDPKQTLLFALELDAAQRTATEKGHLTDGERAVATAKLNVEDYRSLRKSLQNRNHLPYQQFLDTEAKQALAQHGFDLDKAFVNQYAHVFFDAQLAASDAVEGSLKRSTFLLVAQLIKRGLWHPTWGLVEFGKDPAKLAAFNQSKEIEGVMRWLLVDLNFHSIQGRNMVMAGIGFPQMRSPEVVRMMLKLVVHGWSWGPDLSREMLKALDVDASSYVNDPDEGVREGAKKYLAETAPAKRSPRAKPAISKARVSAKSLTCKDLFK